MRKKPVALRNPMRAFGVTGYDYEREPFTPGPDFTPEEIEEAKRLLATGKTWDEVMQVLRPRPKPITIPRTENESQKEQREALKAIQAALAAPASVPAPAAQPADRIPWSGNGVELARHIIAEHHKEIQKAAKAGKKKREISDSTLLKREVPRYCREEDGSPFDHENVRAAYFRSLKRTRRGY